MLDPLSGLTPLLFQILGDGYSRVGSEVTVLSQGKGGGGRGGFLFHLLWKPLFEERAPTKQSFYGAETLDGGLRGFRGSVV